MGLKLNEKFISDAIPLLEKGNFRRTVSDCLGVSEDSFCLWFAKGAKHAKSTLHSDTIYAKFWREVVKAEGNATIRLVDIVNEASKVDARHAEWMLTRRNPDLFGRKDNVMITGSDGGPVKIENVRDRLREKLESLLSAALAAPAAQLGAGDGETVDATGFSSEPE